MSRLIEHSVRLFLAASRAERSEEAFELVTFGGGGRSSPHNLDKTAALLEADDRERYPTRQ